MKTKRFIFPLTVALSLATLAGRAEKQPAAQMDPEPTAGPVAVAAAPDVNSAKWADIKDCTYDTRAQFFTGFKRLEARADGQIAELTARRAMMKDSSSTNEWDFAMKEMVNARSALKSAGEELGKAPSETWDQQKDKVGAAWVRTQDAYAKVKSSTTS